jgi:hypothetical protein
MSADPWSDNVPVPTFGPPMVLHALRDSWCRRAAALAGRGRQLRPPIPLPLALTFPEAEKETERKHGRDQGAYTFGRASQVAGSESDQPNERRSEPLAVQKVHRIGRRGPHGGKLYPP